MTDAPIRSVVVAGGGIVAWSAAAALKRRLPWLEVTIVPLPVPAGALADRIASTLPSIIGFHADLGLRDEDVVARAGSAFRLGTRFEGWAAGLPDYVHAYGEHGRPFGTASFHHHWVRAAQAGAAVPFDRYSAAAMLARADRCPPADDPALAYDHGLQLDLPGYHRMIRAFALHLGVVERGGALGTVELAADGFVAALVLTDGERVAGDLFVDGAGPAAPLRARLDAHVERWREWLPCDRVILADAPADPVLPTADRVVATAAGWRWSAPGRNHASVGIVYSSAHLDDAAAAALIGVGATPAPVTIDQGTRPQPWLRNCVAIGDAATVIEPLEWTNLHLAHSAIDRLIAMLPSRACAPVEIADYNRQTAAETMRVRDFVLLHYAVADRDEPFWRARAAAPLPPSLAHSLVQFRERGRLPVYEEETFARDSWLAVLLGQGTIPRRADPLIEIVPPDASAAAMADLRRMIDAAVARAPTHAALLQAMNRQIAR